MGYDYEPSGDITHLSRKPPRRRLEYLDNSNNNPDRCKYKIYGG
jgi:hypothetical protein